MGDRGRAAKEDGMAKPLTGLKEDRAGIGAEDLIAEAVWLVEGHPSAGILKITGTEVLSRDATFSEHNLFRFRYNQLNHI